LEKNRKKNGKKRKKRKEREKNKKALKTAITVSTKSQRKWGGGVSYKAECLQQGTKGKGTKKLFATCGKKRGRYTSKWERGG